MKNINIVIIGAGNLATNLANALFINNIKIIQIISKSLQNAELLAKKVNSKFSDSIDNIEKAHLVFICTPDAIIEEICETSKLKNKFVVHTAGSVSMDILKKCSINHGVFYPLQTFNKLDLVDFSNIPICIEASNEQTKSILKNIAKLISKNVYSINSEQRLKLHIAAVFTNNFINHIMALTNNFIKEENINKNILKPLLGKTFENILTKEPSVIQTGPAIRNDQITINKHLSSLKNNPDLKDLYQEITDSIKKFHQSNN